MSVSNSSQHYGSVARLLHWLTAGLILVAWPLGWYAASLPWDSAEALAYKAQMFSWHKTLGVLAFFVAVIRILWALGQTHPNPMNPQHRAENWMAALVHFALYAAILLVPLTGWIHHAASEGFAPILLGFGDSLPLIPKSEAISHIFGVAHVIVNYAVFGLVVLHVAGAMKHLVIDRDQTVQRMLTGAKAGAPAEKPKGAKAVAALLWLAVAGLIVLALQSNPAPQSVAQSQPIAAEGGNWEVENGRLGISVRQMGSDVSGEFADWSADIQFDAAASTGNSVTVKINTGSLKLGTVSSQATGPEFLNSALFPEAVFKADILPQNEAWVARGTLSLHGQEIPVELPFTLDLQNNRAVMQGATGLDRRDFGVGEKYGDETTVGFSVAVTVALEARQR